MSKTRGNRPDFLCIGPSKTGTSWLYANLGKHPDIKMPLVKETHYFWGCGDPRQRFMHLNPSIFQSVFGNISLQRRKIYIRHNILPVFRQPGKARLAKLAFSFKYLLMPQSLRWYRSLFPKGYVSGDIDEIYFYFDDDHIQQLLKSHPDIKVFMQVREPVERLWSYVRMYYYVLKRKDMTRIESEEITRRFFRTYANFPSYSEVIERWRRHLDEEQFAIMFYDDLAADPRGYLDDLCDFLEVKEYSDWPESINTRVFKSSAHEIPEKIEKLGLELHLEEYDRLTELVDSPHPGIWKASALQRLSALTEQGDEIR